MSNDPTLLQAAPRIPPPQPTQPACPGDYIKHNTACFKFGSHSSYEMAKTACDSAGARLADIEPVFSKYIRDKVRTMGGNDFWVGSFINRGKLFRQKGRTSCPIMRGQMINDALYGLVDCNSANRYICQKYGAKSASGGLEFNQENPFYSSAYGLDSDVQRPQRINLVSSSTLETPSTTAGEVQAGVSPVIYVVITVCVVVLALIAIKLIIGRYFGKDKKKNKTKTVETAAEINKKTSGDGIVFSPKWRKNPESKASSVDSAVPPSNPSPSLEKSLVLPNINNKQDRHSPKEKKSPGERRMGRPRVNGSQPTRQPPHLNGDAMWSSHTRTLSRAPQGKGHKEKGHRRTYSDPRSDGGYERNEYYSRRRKSSHYSVNSYSSSDSDLDSGGKIGPAKVYQRYPSESAMNRDPHYHYGVNHYGHSRRENQNSHNHYGHGHHGRNRQRSSHNNVYHNDNHNRHTSHRENRYASYGRQNNEHKNQRSSRIQSVSTKVPMNNVQEKQYFPQPHRLMSWVDPIELKDLSAPAEPLVQRGVSLSIQREPIWVNRHIHQPSKSQKHSSKRSKKSRKKGGDENHIYESLDEVKRSKQLKKAARRNKNRKNTDNSKEKRFKRNSSYRASARSVASIQSRRLPSPPT